MILEYVMALTLFMLMAAFVRACMKGNDVVMMLCFLAFWKVLFGLALMPAARTFADDYRIRHENLQRQCDEISLFKQ